MAVKEIWKKVRHPFTPNSLVTLVRNVSEKEQITANVYFRGVKELDAIEGEWRKVIDRVETKFKAELEAAQKAFEAANKKKDNK